MVYDMSSSHRGFFPMLEKPYLAVFVLLVLYFLL